jgi:hypothetical protein
MNNHMSPDWLFRLQLGQCDGHIVTDPLLTLSPTPRVIDYSVRETPLLTVDERRWAIQDAQAQGSVIVKVGVDTRAK